MTDARPDLDACVGSWIRCQRDEPSKGSWSRYAGRVGRIVTLNSGDGEVGVKFTADGWAAESWFLPTELLVVDKPASAPNIHTPSSADPQSMAPRVARRAT